MVDDFLESELAKLEEEGGYLYPSPNRAIAGNLGADNPA